MSSSLIPATSYLLWASRVDVLPERAGDPRRDRKLPLSREERAALREAFGPRPQGGCHVVREDGGHWTVTAATAAEGDDPVHPLTASERAALLAVLDAHPDVRRVVRRTPGKSPARKVKVAA